MLYSRTLLFIYFMYSVSVNAQLLIYPFFPFSTFVTIPLFSASVTTILKRNLESGLVRMHFNFIKKIKIWYMCVEQRKKDDYIPNCFQCFFVCGVQWD